MNIRNVFSFRRKRKFPVRAKEIKATGSVIKSPKAKTSVARSGRISPNRLTPEEKARRKAERQAQRKALKKIQQDLEAQLEYGMSHDEYIRTQRQLQGARLSMGRNVKKYLEEDKTALEKYLKNKNKEDVKSLVSSEIDNEVLRSNAVLEIMYEQQRDIEMKKELRKYEEAQKVKAEQEKIITPDINKTYDSIHEDENIISQLQTGKDFILPEFNQVAVDVFMEQLEKAKDSGYKGAVYLYQFFDRVQGLYGTDVLGNLINNASANGLQISWEQLYYEEQARILAEAFMSYLWDIDAVGQVEYEEAMYMLGQTEDLEWGSYDTDEEYGRK